MESSDKWMWICITVMVVTLAGIEAAPKIINAWVQPPAIQSAQPATSAK